MQLIRTILHKPVPNLSCFQTIRFHAYILLTILYLYMTSGESVWLTLTTVDRRIMETHFRITTAQVTYSNTTLLYCIKLHGITPQKAIKVRARREPIIPKGFTFHFGRYEASILIKLQKLQSKC